MLLGRHFLTAPRTRRSAKVAGRRIAERYSGIAVPVVSCRALSANRGGGVHAPEVGLRLQGAAGQARAGETERAKETNRANRAEVSQRFLICMELLIRRAQQKQARSRDAPAHPAASLAGLNCPGVAFAHANLSAPACAEQARAAVLAVKRMMKFEGAFWGTEVFVDRWVRTLAAEAMSYAAPRPCHKLSCCLLALQSLGC